VLLPLSCRCCCRAFAVAVVSCGCCCLFFWLSFRSAAEESAVNPPSASIPHPKPVSSRAKPLAVSLREAPSKDLSLPLLLPLHLGTPRLQPWVSLTDSRRGALAPGVCRLIPPSKISAHLRPRKTALLLSSLTTPISTKRPAAHHTNSPPPPKTPFKNTSKSTKIGSSTTPKFFPRKIQV
jgi:hypothetical protein